MYVRYRQSCTEEEVAEFFEAELREELHPRYNIAPSQQAPVIRQALQREDNRGTGRPRLLD